MTYFDNNIPGKEFDEKTGSLKDLGKGGPIPQLPDVSEDGVNFEVQPGQDLPPRPYVKSKERFADEQERIANLSPEERQKEIEEHYRSEGLRMPS